MSPVRPVEGTATATATDVGEDGSTGYYDPASEGAFTWKGGEETAEHLDGKHPDYFASHIGSPEEARDKHAALVQSMETSFEVDPGVEVPLPGRSSGVNDNNINPGDDDLFDLSVEMNPYEVKALAGGFRDEHDAEDAEEDDDDDEEERLVLSPLLKAHAEEWEVITPLRSALASKASAIAAASSQKRVRYKLDPGSIVTSPPRELLDAYANNLKDGEGDREEGLDARADDKEHSDRGGYGQMDSRDLEAKLGAITGAGAKEDGSDCKSGDAKGGDYSYDERRERARAEENKKKREEEDDEDEDTPLALDRGASIEPAAFASLYEVLEPACQFTCEISPVGEAFGASLGTAVTVVHPEAVTAHLQRVGFQVVATGPVPTSGDTGTTGSGINNNSDTPGFKMFVFASGYKLKQREGVEGDSLPIFGLCELVIKEETQGSGNWALLFDLHRRSTPRALWRSYHWATSSISCRGARIEGRGNEQKGSVELLIIVRKLIKCYVHSLGLLWGYYYSLQ